jgi:hypothetical protein
MIAFDLRCGAGHVFEAWFASGAAYDRQAADGLLACAFCDRTDIAKAVMAPNVAVKGNRSTAKAEAGAMLRALAAVQAEALKTSSWVGDDFATKARAMHAGDEPDAPIHGRATKAEAKALVDEGVPVAPLPFPVVQPEKVN